MELVAVDETGCTGYGRSAPPDLVTLNSLFGRAAQNGAGISGDNKKCLWAKINRRRRRRRSRYPPRSLLRCLPHSLQDQRSLAGTSNAKGAGVTLPHGTMRGSSSRAATRRRSHRPTARRQGGWDALRCPCRPASSLQQALELRSGHRRAPCPPSQGACASRSLWQGRGMSC